MSAPDWHTRKGYVPLRWWALWFTVLGAALVVFYVLLTPLWMGLRAAAWLAEFRARRRPSGAPSTARAAAAHNRHEDDTPPPRTSR